MHTRQWCEGFCMLIARLLLGGYFFYSGSIQFLAIGMGATFGLIGIPATESFLIFVAVIQLALGAMIILGYKTSWAALGLAAVVIIANVANVIAYGFSEPVLIDLLLMNLAIAGGLICMHSHGSGTWSLDAKLERRSINAAYTQGV